MSHGLLLPQFLLPLQWAYKPQRPLRASNSRHQVSVKLHTQNYRSIISAGPTCGSSFPTLLWSELKEVGRNCPVNEAIRFFFQVSSFLNFLLFPGSTTKGPCLHLEIIIPVKKHAHRCTWTYTAKNHQELKHPEPGTPSPNPPHHRRLVEASGRCCIFLELCHHSHLGHSKGWARQGQGLGCWPSLAQLYMENM